MEFGKKVYVGNFVLIKKTKSLTKKQMKELRNENGIPERVRKELTRGKLPYIRIGNMADNWAVEIGYGLSMFDALDELEPVTDEQRGLTFQGIAGKNVENILVAMFIDTTMVGDAEYQGRKLAIMGQFIERTVKEHQSKEDNEPKSV